jgi:hypothetical protein
MSEKRNCETQMKTMRSSFCIRKPHGPFKLGFKDHYMDSQQELLDREITAPLPNTPVTSKTRSGTQYLSSMAK